MWRCSPKPLEIVHCFLKKMQAIGQQDGRIVEARYRAVVNARKDKPWRSTGDRFDPDPYRVRPESE